MTSNGFTDNSLIAAVPNAGTNLLSVHN